MFMRTQQSADLELAREQAFLLVAIKVQKVARGLICRRRYQRMKEILELLRRAVQNRTDEDLTYALDMCAELPWGGQHLILIKTAKILQSRVREENRVLGLLKNALAVMELNGLKSAINAAASMDPPFSPPILEEARAAVRKLEAEIACKAGLLAAIAAKNLQKLIEFIAVAGSLHLVCSELQQAIGMKARIDEENALLANIRQAIVDRDLDQLNILVSKCAELGIDTRDEYHQAKIVIKDLIEELARKAAAEAEAEKQRLALVAAQEEAERQRMVMVNAQLKRARQMEDADRNLAEAVAACDFTKLHVALNVAMQLGLSTIAVKNAQVWCYSFIDLIFFSFTVLFLFFVQSILTILFFYFFAPHRNFSVRKTRRMI